MDAFIRSALLLGEDNLDILSTKTVMIFGCGGVGSYVVEGLVRTNIQNFVLIDNDTVSESNINRQIIATVNSIGKFKTTVTKERILSINPSANVMTYDTFILPETINSINFSNVDFIIDCIDTISGKLAIIETAKTGLTLFVNDASTAACRLLMQFPVKRSLVTFAPTGKPHSRPKIMAQDASAGNLKGLTINFNGWLNFLRAALDVITEDNT